jgi:hypothetical protein
MGVIATISPTVRGDSPVFQGRVINQRSFLGGGRVLTTTDTAVVIGAGWGGTASFAIAAGSYETRGTVTVTASATTPAQATATIVLTFPGGAYRTAPKVYAARNGGTGSALITPIVASTTTTMTLTASIIPVAGSTYTYDWIIVPVDEPVN